MYSVCYVGHSEKQFKNTLIFCCLHYRVDFASTVKQEKEYSQELKWDSAGRGTQRLVVVAIISIDSSSVQALIS